MAGYISQIVLPGDRSFVRGDSFDLLKGSAFRNVPEEIIKSIFEIGLCLVQGQKTAGSLLQTSKWVRSLTNDLLLQSLQDLYKTPPLGPVDIQQVIATLPKTATHLALPFYVIASKFVALEMDLPEGALPLAMTAIEALEDRSQQNAALVSIWKVAAADFDLPYEIGTASKIREELVRFSVNGVLNWVTEPKLSHLNLWVLPPEIGMCDQLTTLILDGNRIGTLPPEMGNLKQLTFLTVSSNQLTEFPNELAELSKLTIFSFDDNQIKTLPAWMGHFSALEYLSGKSNKIEGIPSTIGRLAALEKLDLSDNLIAFIPSEIGSLGKLEQLILSGNQICEVPESMSDLKKLKELDLQNNKIEALPVGFGLPNLKKLFLCYNELQLLPSTIGKMRKLQELHLNDNKLAELPAEIGRLVRLDALTLHNNHLRTLPSEIGNLDGISLLTVHDNFMDERI